MKPSNQTGSRQWLLNLFLSGLAACSGLAMAQQTPAASTPAASAPAPRAALPGDSVYQVPATLVDQSGQSFKLEQRRGQPMLVSMFYNSCQFVCPMLVDTMRITDQNLSADERAHLSMLLVTFDPARDDVKALKSVTDKHKLDTTRWTVARSDAASVRKIAASLGIQYRLLPDGEYNHTTVMILLDADGRILARTKKMGATDPAFLKQVRQAIASANRAS